MYLEYHQRRISGYLGPFVDQSQDLVLVEATVGVKLGHFHAH